MSGIFSKAFGLNGLSYRLLSYILICSTVLALVITVLQLAWDYNKDVTVIEASIDQIEASFLQPISASLWNLDEEQVKVQIEGIMNLPNMQFVMVKEMLGNSEVPLLTQGVEQAQYDISREFSLTYQGEVVGKLFVELGPRYRSRPGGYLRILKCGFRAGDNAPMAYVELVDRPQKSAAVAADA